MPEPKHSLTYTAQGRAPVGFSLSDELEKLLTPSQRLSALFKGLKAKLEEQDKSEKDAEQGA